MIRLLFSQFCLAVRQAIFPGASRMRHTMESSRQVEASNCKDCAKLRLVHQEICRPRLCLRVLELCIVASVYYLTGSAGAAQRTPAAHGADASKVIESFFQATPGYQQGDLITRSQIEKALKKLD